MNKNIFYTLIVGCILLFSQYTYGQPGLKTGSLQIVVSSGVPPVIAEIAGPLTFSESISENLILSNLIPGEYAVKVFSSQRNTNSSRLGIGISNTTIVQKIFVIAPETKTIITISKNGFSISSDFDQNSNYVHASINPNIRPEYPSHRHEIQPMSRSEFAQLYNTVKNASYDSERIQAVAIVTPSTMFTTEQIRQIMKALSFDDSRLVCAKIMSQRVLDMQNIHLLVDTFSFNSSKEKFYDFISSISSPTPYNR